MTSIQLTSAELGRVAGPLLIGYMLNWGLFGVLSMQVYLFSLAFPNDGVRFKALVYGVYFLEAAQTVLFTSSAFRTFASGFGNFTHIDEVDTLWFSVPIMSGLIGFVAQTFYAYRIAVLTQTKYLAGLIMLLACFSLSGSIALAVEVKNAALFSDLFRKKTSFTTAGIWGGGSAACDVLIAISMTYYLKRLDSGIKQTRVLLRRIIRLTIETGSLTAAVALISLLLTLLPGPPTYYQTGVCALGKLYSNSMMAVFNSRMKIESTGTTHERPVVSDLEFGIRSTRGGASTTRAEVSSGEIS